VNMNVKEITALNVNTPTYLHGDADPSGTPLVEPVKAHVTEADAENVVVRELIFRVEEHPPLGIITSAALWASAIKQQSHRSNDTIREKSKQKTYALMAIKWFLQENQGDQGKALRAEASLKCSQNWKV